MCKPTQCRTAATPVHRAPQHRKAAAGVALLTLFVAAESSQAAVQFWDGGTANKSANNTVDGGAGTWNTTLVNWTSGDGSVENTYTSGVDAVFQGATGIISLGSAITGGGINLTVNDTIDLAGFNLSVTGLVGSTGSIYSNTSGATFTVNIAGTNTYGGDLGAGSSNSMAFVKSGAGTLVLNKSVGNNYKGGTFTVNDGTVQSNGFVSSGATFNIGDGTGASGSAVFQLLSTSLTTSIFQSTNSVLNINSDGQVDLAGRTLSTSGIGYTITFLNNGGSIVGNGASTTGGANTLIYTLSTANVQKVLTISGSGSVNLAGGNLTADGQGSGLTGTSTGLASVLALNNGAALNTQNGNVLITSQDNGVSGTTKAGPTQLSSTGGGSINTGAGALIFATGGSDGTATSANLTTSTQSIVVGTNTLSIAGNILIGQASLGGNAATNQSNRTLLLTPASGATLSISAAIANGGTNVNNGITMNGGGTTNLTGPNTYTGITSVTGGKLVVGSAGSINNSSGVTINGGELAYNGGSALTPAITFTSGTISGTGTVGAITAGTNNTVAPGMDSTAGNLGTLKTGNLTLGSGSSYKADINLASSLGTVGTTAVYTSDTIDVTGSVTLGGALVLNFVNAPQRAINKTVVLILNDSTEAISNTFSSITPVSVNGGIVDYQIFYNYDAASGAFGSGNDVAITFTSVPEPASLSMLAIGSAALLGRRRRSR